MRSSALSSLCDEASAGADIEITQVAPAVFKEVLRFAYCDELSSADALSTMDGTRTLLDAANRFSCWCVARNWSKV